MAKNSLLICLCGIYIIMHLGPDFPPTNLTGSALDSTTIILNWHQPNSPHNGIIREYRVNITEDETGNVLQHLVTTTTDLVVRNLHPDYTYTWTVTAFTVAEGPYSSIARVKMPEDGTFTSCIVIIAPTNLSTLCQLLQYLNSTLIIYSSLIASLHYFVHIIHFL